MPTKKKETDWTYHDLIIGSIIILMLLYVYNNVTFPYVSNSKLFFLLTALFIIIMFQGGHISRLKKQIENGK